MIKNLTIVFGLLASLSLARLHTGTLDTVTPGMATTNLPTTGLSTMDLSTMDPATTRYTPANTERCNDVGLPFGLIVCA
jgi:hypothetical protein